MAPNGQAELTLQSAWGDEYAFILEKQKSSATEEDNEGTLHADKEFGVSSLSDLCSTAASVGTYDPSDQRRDGTGCSLAHRLPEWIVSEARDQYENGLRRGHKEEARSILEVKLELLKRPLSQDSNCWRLNRVELLLDLDRKEEAHDLLDISVRSAKAASGQESDPQAWYTDSDREYREKHAIQLLKLSAEIGDSEQVNDAVDNMRRVYPEYLDLSKQLPFFEDCRRHLRLGALSEKQVDADPSQAREHLTRALDVYNTGCQNIEVRHFQTDMPKSMVLVRR